MTDTLSVEKDNLRVRAYGVIRKALMTGRFKPGQKLLLRSLASDLGISITPVREALLQLVAEQALIADSSRSLFVPIIEIDRFREIRDLRIELEGRATQAAALRALKADVRELEHIHREMIEFRVAGDFREALICNEAFHFRIYAMAQMPVLYGIIERLWVQIGPIFRHLFDNIDPTHTVNHPHVEIIAALSNHSGSAARIALANDISWASRHLEAWILSNTSPKIFKMDESPATQSWI